MLLAADDMRGKRSRKRRGSTDISLVARDGEFAIILDQIGMKKNLHVYGDEGVGKSALLDQVYDFLKARGTLVPIYCRSSRTLRQILLCIAAFLLEHFKNLDDIDKFKKVKEIEHPSDIKKLSIRHLRNLIFAHIPQDDFCVILDHFECVTPKINGFLTTLYEKALVVTASRQSWELSDYGFTGRLDYSPYLVPKLRIENLKRKNAFVLIESLCRNMSIAVPSKQKMFDEIFRVSKGNPGIISTIFEKARRPEYHRGTGLNLKLILIDSRIEEIA